MVNQSETGTAQFLSASAIPALSATATTFFVDDYIKEEEEEDNLAMDEDPSPIGETTSSHLHLHEGPHPAPVSTGPTTTPAPESLSTSISLQEPLLSDESSAGSDESNGGAPLSTTDSNVSRSVAGSIFGPFIDETAAAGSNAARHANPNDRDMDLSAVPSIAPIPAPIHAPIPANLPALPLHNLDIPVNFMQDANTNMAPSWTYTAWGGPDGNRSLILDHELASFRVDALPRHGVGMYLGPDSSGSNTEIEDAEQFYPSDDEDSDYGIEPYYMSSVEHTNIPTTTRGPITPPTENFSGSLFSTDNNHLGVTELAELPDSYFYGLGDDADMTDVSAHIDSTSDHFLCPSPLISSPSSFYADTPPFPLQTINPPLIGGDSRDTNAGLMQLTRGTFIQSSELVTISSLSVPPLPPTSLSRFCQLLEYLSYSSRQRAMVALVVHGLRLGHNELSSMANLLASEPPVEEQRVEGDEEPTIPPLLDEDSETLPSTDASPSGDLIPVSPQPHPPLLTQQEYVYLHERSDRSPYYIPPAIVLRLFDVPTASTLLAAYLAPPDDANYVTYPAIERNLTVEQFIRQWYIRSRLYHQHLDAKEPVPPISAEAANVLQWARPAKISRPENHRSRQFDIQNIPWTSKLNVDRATARVLRDRWYTSYHNLRYQAHGFAKTIPATEGYFKPKTMYSKYRSSMAHFQLRNLMSVTASNTVQYAYRSKVYTVTPFYNHQKCIIDLSDSNPAFLEPVKISTMKVRHGITVVGGFSGEYAYKSQFTDQQVIEGRITGRDNGITNHIDIVQHRTSSSPHAVIASNDECIRILDCETNKFVKTHPFARAINCTDTSPDGRLRVIIGDSVDAWVVDSDSGKPVQALSGHRDYGFACAWSPDMLHIATSNQDKTVNIWDARMWRILQTIDSDVAGYRSLRFSPVGGGPRTLLMCEPADRLVIVNAQTYQTRQVHEFFGEIGGADFTPDGGRIWLSNMDSRFGGLMEYDRVQWGQEFGISHTRRSKIEARGDVYYPDLPNEWLPEDELDDDPRCVLNAGERRVRFERLMSDTEFAKLNRFLG